MKENDFLEPSLRQAVKEGSIDKLRRLLDKGCTLEWKCDQTGQGLLHLAVENGHVALVEWLVPQVDIQATDNMGNNVLHVAVKHELKEIAPLLIKHGVSYEEENNLGKSPLDIATTDIKPIMEAVIDGISRQAFIAESDAVSELHREVKQVRQANEHHNEVFTKLRDENNSLQVKLEELASKLEIPSQALQTMQGSQTQMNQQRQRDMESARVLQQKKAKLMNLSNDLKKVEHACRGGVGELLKLIPERVNLLRKNENGKCPLIIWVENQLCQFNLNDVKQLHTAMLTHHNNNLLALVDKEAVLSKLYESRPTQVLPYVRPVKVTGEDSLDIIYGGTDLNCPGRINNWFKNFEANALVLDMINSARQSRGEDHCYYILDLCVTGDPKDSSRNNRLELIRLVCNQYDKLLAETKAYLGAQVNNGSSPESVGKSTSLGSKQTSFTAELVTRDSLFKTRSEKSEEIELLLKQEIPESHDCWKAKGRGDCFFDAMALGLNAIFNVADYSTKSLRLLCSDYARELDKKCEGNPHHENNWLGKSLKQFYQQYLANIQFTVEEREQGEGLVGGDNLAVWGEEHIDGRILCEKLGISVHILEVRENPDFDEEGGARFIVGHNLVTADRLRNIVEENVDYENNRTIHLAICNNHFVPILNKSHIVKMEDQVKARNTKDVDGHVHSTQHDPQIPGRSLNNQVSYKA